MNALRTIGLCCLLLSVPCLCSGEDLRVSRVFVKLIQEVEIPARKPGALMKMLVSEGAVVSKGQELARMDDQQALIDVAQAKTDLESAMHKAQDLSALELSKKKHQEQNQSLKQAILENNASRRAAKNLFKIEAAEKARDVAGNELERAMAARAEVADAVSQSEIDGLRLSFERSELDAKQAKFEQEQQGLAANASDEAVVSKELAVESAQIQIRQAQLENTIAQLDAELKKHALESAELHFEQHRIRSSIDGIVVEVLRQEGEWLQPGDPVLRVLRLNRLRVEGYVAATAANQSLVGQPVEIEILGAGKDPLKLEGTLTFVSPQVDVVNQQVTVWAEFDNADMLVRPGMQGSMVIQWQEDSKP